jgi:hypothetical protein
MAGERRIERRRREIEELAEGWGKLLAREVFPDGVGLDVDLFTMEELAVTAAKSLVRGAVETMTGDQAESLGTAHPCPGCGKRCPLDHRSRAIQVRAWHRAGLSTSTWLARVGRGTWTGSLSNCSAKCG